MMPNANAILTGWVRSEMTAGIMANEKIRQQCHAAHSDAALRELNRPKAFAGFQPALFDLPRTLTPASSIFCSLERSRGSRTHA